MTARLRAGRPTDAGRCGEILWRFAHETEWMPELHTGAEAIAFCGAMLDRGWVTVAETDGHVVGFLARDDEEIVALYVASEARGRGIGERFLEQAKAASARLILWTFQANTGAQRFYERHGFGEIDRTGGARNEEGLPDIRYVWTRESDT